MRKNDRQLKWAIMPHLTKSPESVTYYTGRALLMRITYVLDDEEFCKPGYIILGLEPTHMINTKPDNMAELLCPNNPREIKESKKESKYE